MAAHRHTFDVVPPSPLFASPRVRCTECGFGVPLQMLVSKTNLDSLVALKNASPAVKQAVADLQKGGK